MTLLTPVLAVWAAISPAAFAQSDQSLADLLAGRTPCRSQEIGALVTRLDYLPGLASADDARQSVAGRFDSWCGKKAGALFFQSKGLLAGRVRSDSYAVWVEQEGGRVVRNAELPSVLEELAVRAYEAGRADPSGQPTMTRHFTLVTDGPGLWRTQWSGANGAPAELVVNRGDTVALRLVNGLYSMNTPAGFVLEGYNVRYDVFPTDGRGVAVPPFVADVAGKFPFYELRSPNRIAGVLIVRPK